MGMLSIVRLSAVDRSEGEGDGIGIGRLVGKIGGEGVVEVAGAAGAVEGGRGGHPREGGVVGNGRGNGPGMSPLCYDVGLKVIVGLGLY